MSALEQVTYITRGPREILREWVETVTGEGSEYDVSELVDRAHHRFSGDPEMAEALLAWGIRELMPQVAGQVFAKWRRQSRQNFENEVTRKLARFYEHVGETRHKSLLDMNRAECFFTAEQREARAAGELTAAALARDLGSGLLNDTQTVRERYSEDELLTVWRRHYEDE